MKSLAMCITNQKLSFDIFMVGKLQNIFMDNFDSYNVFLTIATNIPVQLKIRVTYY